MGRVITQGVPRRGDKAARDGAGVPKHLLPPLPYDYAALEPHIDARTGERFIPSATGIPSTPSRPTKPIS